MRPGSAFRSWAALAGVLATAACERPSYDGPKGRFWEKGPYQAVYGADGRLVCLLHDSNGDQVADAVIFYGTDGVPIRGELDTNLDGVVDRWEEFEAGNLVRVLLDTDGDGKPDRTEVGAP